MSEDSGDRQPSSTMLYVSNLPFSVEDDELARLFGAQRPQVAYVARRRNGRSKGFGFVTFANHDDQQAALAAAEGMTLEDRPLNVSVAHHDPRRNERGELLPEYAAAEAPRSRNRRGRRGGGGGGGGGNSSSGGAAAEERVESETLLYVSNLPFSFEDDDLQELFQPYGSLRARVARRDSGRSKGFGFLEMADHASQQSALALDGHVVDERPLQVRVSYSASFEEAARPKTKRSRRRRGAGGGGGGDGGSGQQPQQQRQQQGPSETLVYVGSLPYDATDDDLASVFAGYDVVSARVARRGSRSKGFGFVELASHEEQQRALELDGTPMQERTLQVLVAQSDRPQRAKREPRPTQPSQTMLYVANLPFSVDDEELSQLFAAYNVVEAHVATRRNGRSKGFAFVTLASHDDQQAALAAMDGHEVDERPLNVEVAREPVANGDDAHADDDAM